MTESGEELRRVAALLAFAEIVSPHLGDRRMLALTAAFDEFCLEALTEDLSDLPMGVDLMAARQRLTPEDIDRWVDTLTDLDKAGIDVALICHDNYPVNLRTVFDRPPLLFVAGSLPADDPRAVAIVGTRKASAAGLRLATDLGHSLAESGITIVSGMARGIDSAAHSGAMRASGRTIAVLGQGLRAPMARDRAEFARKIAAGSGAVVSQFWPRQGGTNWTFPIRNRVTSGLSQATVVVEAGPTSGAKLQAHDALRHGRRVYLVEQLVLQQPWAQELAENPAVSILTHVDELVQTIETDLTAWSDVLV